MDADISAELLDHVPTDDEAQRRIKTAYTRRLVEIYPEAAHEIGKKLRDEGLREGLREGRDEGLLQMLALQFKLRLDRALSPDELATLDRRVHTLGAERVGRVVLDMSRDALEAWLRDPHAA